MDTVNPDAERYLKELYQRTEGNTGTQVSMFDIGEAVGLEKESARRLAEDLIAEGLIEIRTLSGGIGITSEGIDMAQPDGGGRTGARRQLGNGPLIEEQSRLALESILTEIKRYLASSSTPYTRLEEMVLDLKTIDTQLLSPRPKTAVIREVLRSLKDGLADSGAAKVAADVARFIDG